MVDRLSHTGARPSAGEAGEPEYRVQLDRVRRHSRLTVVVVEEANADYPGSGADPGDPSSRLYLLTDALELTVLIGHKDPRRHPRIAICMIGAKGGWGRLRNIFLS